VCSSDLEIIKASVEQYRSKWLLTQHNYVEVWLEKEALAQVFSPITDEYGVFLSVSGGYPKLSQIYNAKVRFEEYYGKPIKLLYFGDLDPSGKDMPRQLKEQLQKLDVENAEVIEVALNENDVVKYNLPQNPFKPKDTRNKWYVERYGIDYAVELDALEPNILEGKIRDSILTFIDHDELEYCKYADRTEMNKWNKIIRSKMEQPD
jgi:hypothetical protein